MKKIAMFVGLLALAAPSLMITPAQAQATRTWISGVGDDVNPCSRTAPCKTFPGAIAKTAAGGEIDTLDPGGFGAVTVVKSITLANEGVGEAGILVAGTNGVTVNLSTCPNGSDTGCTVILRGLQIDGGPTGSNSLAGVKFITGRALIIQNCQIRNFQGGNPNGYGVSFTPTGGTSELDITDSTIENNGQIGGNVTVGAGLWINPTGTPTIKASIVRTQFLNNTNNVRIDTTTATGGSVKVTMHDVLIQGSANHGLAIVTGASGTATQVAFDQSQTVNNNGSGIVANGAGAAVYMSNSVSTGNTGDGILPAGGGVINTFKNNVIIGNTTDNTAAATQITPT